MGPGPSVAVGRGQSMCRGLMLIRHKALGVSLLSHSDTSYAIDEVIPSCDTKVKTKVIQNQYRRVTIVCFMAN